jgi:pimeloyl-ACP methyl ester carboxylesterase
MTEFVKAADGVRIAYETVGSGPSVVLVHGFAASRVQNWKDPGWYETLTGAGYRVVAMDCRGHGDSDKPHEPSAYDHSIMAEDVVAVMEAANASPAFLMGYSMGGFISMHVLMDHPELIKKLVIGGVGGSYLGRAFGPRDAIADALLIADKSKITDPVQRSFREFAEQSGKDRLALAACMRANRRPFTTAELKQSQRPVLVVCGENDDLTGPPGPLADAFADGRAVMVPRRDHMTTVGDKVYKQAALEFFRA